MSSLISSTWQNWDSSLERLTLVSSSEQPPHSLHCLLPTPIPDLSLPHFPFHTFTTPPVLVSPNLPSLLYPSQPVALSPIVVFVPRGVLDIQDAPTNSSQHVQIFMKDVLNLQQVPCYLGPLSTKEARKWTLLAIFPAGEMILTVTYLKKKSL